MKCKIEYFTEHSWHYSYVKHGWWPFWRFVDQTLSAEDAMDSIKDYKRRLDYKHLTDIGVIRKEENQG